MRDDLILHKIHGVNPTMPICYVCGKETGEIALLGAGYRGKAPKYMCINKKPCEECEKQIRNGRVILVGVKNGEPQSDNPNRSGKLAYVTTGFFERAFDMPVPKQGICFVENTVMEEIEKLFNEMEEK